MLEFEGSCPGKSMGSSSADNKAGLEGIFCPSSVERQIIRFVGAVSS